MDLEAAVWEVEELLEFHRDLSDLYRQNPDLALPTDLARIDACLAAYCQAIGTHEKDAIKAVPYLNEATMAWLRIQFPQLYEEQP